MIIFFETQSKMSSWDNDDERATSVNTKNIMMSVAGAAAIGVGAFVALRFKVANANQFVAKTGLGIRGISLSKKTLQLPFQTAQIYDVNPFAHNFNLKCMSKEMIEMKLPIAFTMQPIIPDKDSEMAVNYTRRLLNIEDQDAINTISNVLEGTTRTLSGQLSIDELFHNREAFRDKVVAGVAMELGEIGLEIVTANIQEMGDSDENNLYFTYRKQRATESANHQARIDVAEAKKTGEIGVAEREGEIRIKTAVIERDATLAENERNQAIAKSNADLEVVQAESKRQADQARVEASISVEKKRVELEKELEQKRCERELESERAAKLAHAIVDKEKVETDAQANLYNEQRLADARAYQIEKQAEAKLFEAEKDAEAILIKAQREAEGVIALKEAEARGVLAVKNAEAEGLKNILEASQENPTLTQFYLGLNEKLPQKQAEESAKALQNLSPKVHLWNTNGGEGSDAITNTFASLAHKLIPALDATQDTIKVPKYLPQPKPQA